MRLAGNAESKLPTALSSSSKITDTKHATHTAALTHTPTQMSQSSERLSESDLWETQSNASTMENNELENLSVSTFDQLPQTTPRSLAHRHVTLDNVGGGGKIVISENDNALDLAMDYCSTHDLDFHTEDGALVVRQISLKILQLLRWKLSQTRKRLKKATGHEVKEKFMHAVNLLQRTQHDKKKLALKLATTRSNLHEKKEELVQILSSVETTREELVQMTETFETYKKENERVQHESEQRSIAQMQKVVLANTSSLDTKVTERIEAVQHGCETKLQEASKEFEIQLDAMQKDHASTVAQLRLEKQMATSRVAQLTRQLAEMAASKQLAVAAKLRRIQDLQKQVDTATELTTQAQARMEGLHRLVETAETVRDQALETMTNYVSSDGDTTQWNTVNALTQMAAESEQLAVAKAVERAASKEEKKLQAIHKEHEGVLLHREQLMQDLQATAQVRVELEVEKASTRAKEAEKEAELQVRHAQTRFSKRRSSIVKQKEKLRLTVVQEKAALTRKAEQAITRLQTAHEQTLEEEAARSKKTLATLQVGIFLGDFGNFFFVFCSQSCSPPTFFRRKSKRNAHTGTRYKSN